MHFDKESLFLRTLHSKNTAKGVGDDAVILTRQNRKNIAFSKPKASFAQIIDSGREFVIANDGFCEGIHFKREWLSISQITKKAMLVNISDMVAMNASPKYAIISIVLPQLSPQEIIQIATSLNDSAKEFGISIIGGDTMSGKRLDFHITLFGVPNGKILFRKGLKNGDLVFCTGEVGSSLKALQYLARSKNQNIINTKSKRFSRFVSPRLRGKFIKSIANFAHCGLDISDGVLAELNRLSNINHLGFSLAKAKSTKTNTQNTQNYIKSSKILPKAIRQKAYLSGEEYEMLFAISPKHKTALFRKARQNRISLCFIATAKRQKTRFKTTIWH